MIWLYNHRLIFVLCAASCLWLSGAVLYAGAGESPREVRARLKWLVVGPAVFVGSLLVERLL